MEREEAGWRVRGETRGSQRLKRLATVRTDTQQGVWGRGDCGARFLRDVDYTGTQWEVLTGGEEE